jgi:3-oxoacyl-[acyl-carrier-protein] synthase II
LDLPGIDNSVCAFVPALPEKEIARKFRRTMSRTGLFAAFAAKEAADSAGLGQEMLSSGRVGVSAASTVNSPYALEEVFRHYLLAEDKMEQIRSTSFFKIMNHSCATNITQYLGLSGRTISPAAACATGGQCIALGAEAVACGLQEAMLCGGADEVHPLTINTFDRLDAASAGPRADPKQASRPFDLDRDGVVCAEGAGMLVLESLDSAKSRQAPILGEIAGWSMNCTTNLVLPDPKAMRDCIWQALNSSDLSPEEIGYVNAHATSTIQGDAEEARVIAQVFKGSTPVSSLKGHLGHTMAACGALETMAILKMFEEDLLLGTMNLERLDPECMGIDVLQADKQKRIDTAIKNNFAFGGINTVLVIRRYSS